MDKLKYIKIEKEDGSLSDSIPLTADAVNITMANGNSAEDEINSKINENQLNDVKNNLQNSIIANTSAINIQTSRIDNLSTLTEGSTTGDAELIDGRIGYNSIEYTNIGNAIRGQIQDLHNNTRAIFDVNFFNNLTPSKSDLSPFEDQLKRDWNKYYMVPGIFKSLQGSFITKIQFKANKEGELNYWFIEATDLDDLKPGIPCRKVGSISLSNSSNIQTYTFKEPLYIPNNVIIAFQNDNGAMKYYEGSGLNGFSMIRQLPIVDTQNSYYESAPHTLGLGFEYFTLNNSITGYIMDELSQPFRREAYIIPRTINNINKPTILDLDNQKITIPPCYICLSDHNILDKNTETILDFSNFDYRKGGYVWIYYNKSTKEIGLYDYFQKDQYFLGIFQWVLGPDKTGYDYTYKNALQVSYLNADWTTPETTKGKKFVAFGDSITYGLRGQSWTYKVAEICEFAKVHNLGYSGSLVCGSNPNIPTFLDRYSQIDADADYITI